MSSHLSFLFCPVDHIQTRGSGFDCKHQCLGASQAAPESPGGNGRGTPRAPGPLLLFLIFFIHVRAGDGASTRAGHQTGASGPARARGEGAEGEKS